jgi:hypothetical protein
VVKRHSFTLKAAREVPLPRKKPNDLPLIQQEIDDPTAYKSRTAGNQGSHVPTPVQTLAIDLNRSSVPEQAGLSSVNHSTG